MRILNDLEELDGTMSSSQALPTGRLRIDISAGLALIILIPALPTFHAKYPDIQIDLGVTDRTVDLVGENVDCVLRAGDITDQSLIARRIGLFDFVTVATPGYLEKHGEPKHPTDIEGSGHTVVSYFGSGGARVYPMTFKRGDETLEITGRHLFASNDGNSYVAALLRDYGVGQGPRFMVDEEIAAGRLKIILTEWTHDPMPLYIVYPPNRHLSNKLRVFVDWAAELFAREPWRS
jgi:DNA-binding transcriptional LysR family regulator